MNKAPDLLFQCRFGSLEDFLGSIHDGFPTIMRIASLPAVPRFILAAVLCAGLIKAVRFSQV
jgi:hypothetical protein